MKRLLSFCLAGCFALGMAVAGSASDGKIDIQEKGDDVNGRYMPGKNYSFDLYEGNTKLDSDFFKWYSTRVEVTEGTGYITRPQIKKQSNGVHTLDFYVNPSKSYKDDVDVEITITTIDKDDRDVTYTDSITFTVGYGGSQYTADTEFTVYEDTPLIEFDDDLRGEVLTVSFEDYASIEYKHSGTRMVNFAFTPETNDEVMRKNLDADMTFIEFYGGPSLPSKGTFSLYAPGARYLYRISGDGSLTRLNAHRDGDYMVTDTDRLTAFVASDIQLKGASSEVPSSSSSNTTTPSSSQTTSSNTPSGGSTKPNPSTGAIA